MAVSRRVESQQIAGLLTGFVGTDLQFATISGSLRLTQMDLRLTDAPSGDTVVAMVNTVAGGGGTDLLQGTIADGDTFVSVTGDIAISGTTPLYLRVVSEGGAPMGLSASVELSDVEGVTATVWLSTLARVKEYLKITDADNDAAIQSTLEGISRGMQNWMSRDIVQTVRTVEYHLSSGLSSALVLEDGPIVSVEEVRKYGDVLTAENYRTEHRILRRMSGTIRRTWEDNAEIEVDYTSGYATVPSDLVEACTEEAARHYLMSKTGGGPGIHANALTPSSGDTKSFIEGGFLPTTIAAMMPYRIWKR